MAQNKLLTSTLIGVTYNVRIVALLPLKPTSSSAQLLSTNFLFFASISSILWPEKINCWNFHNKYWDFFYEEIKYKSMCLTRTSRWLCLKWNYTLLLCGFKLWCKKNKFKYQNLYFFVYRSRNNSFSSVLIYYSIAFVCRGLCDSTKCVPNLKEMLCQRVYCVTLHQQLISRQRWDFVSVWTCTRYMCIVYSD